VLHIFYVGTYVLEAFLLLRLLYVDRWRENWSAMVFAVALVVVDAVVRPLCEQWYGTTSRVFFYTYWISDVVLLVLLFGVVCSFFPRSVRWVMLGFFAGMCALAAAVLRFGFSQIAASGNLFIYAFEQILYMCCLALDTALLVVGRCRGQCGISLRLFVSGIGIQTAGAAVILACWVYQYPKDNGSLDYLPLATMLMLAAWLLATFVQTREEKGEVKCGL